VARAAVPRLDLMTDPLLGIRSRVGEPALASLPEVLAALGRDEVAAFTALQAHQQHAWHAFLVQLAAIALHRAGEDDPRRSAAHWRELLLALTAGKPEPWCLVVADLGRPAFMQPPVPEGTLEAFKEEQANPDAIEILATGKNHDVKRVRIARPRPEHWVYALVALQTMQGVYGAGNYGIARMNGGLGSRPGLGLAPSSRPGQRFVRDVRVLLEARDGIAAGYRKRGGKALLWVEPWDGKEQLDLDAVDPWFVEVCRRVRLVECGGVLAVRCTTSEGQRLAAKELKGVTGDPWTPVNRAENKAFTASEEGFSYRVLSRLLGDGFEPGAAQKPRTGEKDMSLFATVLARGQGKTAGFHERVVPVPEGGIKVLRRSNGRAELGKLAAERVELAAIVQRKVLRPALCALLQGGGEKLDLDDRRADRWIERLDAAIEREFFERLWADLDGDRASASRRWAKRVVALAEAQLRDAIESAPIPSARRYRAIAAAEGMFHGGARNHVSIAFDEQEKTDE
jgi:CRISPR system Cascade subunit CasA